VTFSAPRDAAQQKEIGIRLALGASRSEVIVSSVKFWIQLAFVGVLAGVAVSAAISKNVQPLLYEVSPLDMPTYLLALLVFGLGIGLAAYATAGQAASLDPARAIRD